MKAITIEKQFTHNGLICFVIANNRSGHRCGYVGIDKNNFLYGKGYSDKIIKEKDEVMAGSFGKRNVITLMFTDWEGNLSPEQYFNVHGGITYAAYAHWQDKKDGLWYFGFDCAHSGDAKDLNIMLDEKLKAFEIESRAEYPNVNEVVRTAEYVEQECKSLAEQLKKFEKEN